jgi:hypothetical protein
MPDRLRLAIRYVDYLHRLDLILRPVGAISPLGVCSGPAWVPRAT